jgi:Carboxypeptidase regulatory-like domain
MMRRITHLLSAFLFACGVIATAAQAQSLTGTIEGKVADPQGALLPGVTLTLTGPRGEQTTVSDEQGNFRFVGILPDTYKVKTDLSGFLAQEVEAIVGAGKTVTMDLSLKLSTVTETVNVLAAASTVDVKSAATDTNITNDLLTLMPIYSATSTGLLNNAPGINNSSAYGGQGSYGNALLLDGVDTRDPEGGSPWTFFNQNLVQEVQIGGLGAPAEYGGFSGAIVNTITKSGGNAFSGLFSIRYTGDSLASANLNDELLDANPGLGDAAITKKLTDYTVQMGGPVKRDKAFFFANVQRYSAKFDPIGPVANNTDISPRFNVKLTLQPSPTNTIIAGMQYDSYNVTGRNGNWPAAQAGDNQTVEEDAPEWVWNFQWRKVFGASTFLEAKFTGYSGYYNLDPVDPTPYIYDFATDEYCCGGGGGLYYADRSRNQGQVALTKYADKFGKHTLKFGAEIERSHVRSQGQPYGPAGFYVYAYDGVPYYTYTYGYDVQGDNKRTSIYAQDQWSAGKLTLNIGVRLDHIRGNSPILDRDVYKPKSSWGPRIGASYDLTGKGTTALKVYYGRYFEGTATGFFSSAVPGIQDLTKTPILNNRWPGGTLGTPEVLLPGIIYGIDSDIRHPKTDEFNVSFETQLTSTLRFSATGIWREQGNFINNVIEGAQFRPVQLTNQLTNQPLTGYFWANAASTNENFFITNIKGSQYIATDGSVIATADPKRSYKGLMLLLSSSLKNRLGYQLSYVLAKAEGTVDNTGFGAWLGGTSWNSPNTAITNADGELTNSRRHEIKAYVSYQIPRADVMLAGIYTGESGRPYTPFGQFSLSQLNLPSAARRQIFLEPRGSERNDFFNQVDLRAEKAFRYAGQRFGVFTDITNLFNTATATTRQARVPSTTISGHTVLYQAPTVVQAARQVTFGGRWTF